MAEYYPLLARTLASLPTSTPETRGVVYERARKALTNQLRTTYPPPSKQEAVAETKMLEEAISQLEAEIQKGVEPTIQKPLSFSERLKQLTKKREEEAQQRALIQEKSGSVHLQADQTPPLPSPPLQTEGNSSSPASKFQDIFAKARASRPHIKPVAEPIATPEPQRSPEKAQAFLHAFKEAMEAPGPSGKKKEDEGTPPTIPSLPPLPASSPSLKPAPHVANLGQQGILRKYGRLSQKSPSPSTPSPPPVKEIKNPPIPGALPTYPPSPFDEEEEGAPLQKGIADTNLSLGISIADSIRPLAPQTLSRRPTSLRHWFVASVLLVLVMSVALTAYFLRDRPDTLARLKPLIPESSIAANNKVTDRAGEQRGNSAVSRAAPSPPPPAQVPYIPIAHRAALLLQNNAGSSDTQSVTTYIGTVLWRLDKTQEDPIKQPQTVVVADVDIPEAKLKATLVIRQNDDNVLPASHVLDIRFFPLPGSLVSSVKQIEVPLMRREDTPLGEPLTGVASPIMDNIFRVALVKSDLYLLKNLDLLRTRGWLDVPVVLGDGRIGKLTFEKGTSGDRILGEAAQIWKP